MFTMSMLQISRNPLIMSINCHGEKFHSMIIVNKVVALVIVVCHIMNHDITSSDTNWNKKKT